MGVSGSKLERALGDQFPEGEHYFGLENFGNTCYCNSILQALYFCLPFREKILDYASNRNRMDTEENLLTCLADLFVQISSQKRRTGYISPKHFVQRLKKQNEEFRNFTQQDAHEFLNFLLNSIAEVLVKEEQDANDGSESPEVNPPKDEPLVTWVHKFFQGFLTSQTRCLQCYTVTSRHEPFFELSIDVHQNSSITSCLNNFSSMEIMNANDKFFCDTCSSLQEAQKRIKIKECPQILVIHLKRFKFMENLGRYKKLCYRVAFSHELKLTNTVGGEEPEYSLFAVVIHLGSGPNHGHYVTLVRSHDRWLYFDDDNVDIVDESLLQTYFGSAQEYSSNTEQGYILLYESVDANNKN